MPIQIRELVIRATISEGEKSENTIAPATGGGTSKKGKGDEKVVRQCVDEVLEILRVQNER